MDSWKDDNSHIPDEWWKGKEADTLLLRPRPKSQAPQLPMAGGPDKVTEADIDVWGEKMETWQKENSHLPSLRPVSDMVTGFKARLKQQKEGTARPEVAANLYSSTRPEDTRKPAVTGEMKKGKVVHPAPADQEAFEGYVEDRLGVLEDKLNQLLNHLGVPHS